MCILGIPSGSVIYFSISELGIGNWLFEFKKKSFKFSFNADNIIFAGGREKKNEITHYCVD